MTADANLAFIIPQGSVPHTNERAKYMCFSPRDSEQILILVEYVGTTVGTLSHFWRLEVEYFLLGNTRAPYGRVNIS